MTLQTYQFLNDVDVLFKFYFPDKEANQLPSPKSIIKKIEDSAGQKELTYEQKKQLYLLKKYKDIDQILSLDNFNIEVQMVDGFHRVQNSKNYPNYIYCSVIGNLVKYDTNYVKLIQALSQSTKRFMYQEKIVRLQKITSNEYVRYEQNNQILQSIQNNKQIQTVRAFIFSNMLINSNTSFNFIDNPELKKINVQLGRISINETFPSYVDFINRITEDYFTKKLNFNGQLSHIKPENINQITNVISKYQQLNRTYNDYKVYSKDLIKYHLNEINPQMTLQLTPNIMIKYIQRQQQRNDLDFCKKIILIHMFGERITEEDIINCQQDLKKYFQTLVNIYKNNGEVDNFILNDASNEFNTININQLFRRLFNTNNKYYELIESQNYINYQRRFDDNQFQNYIQQCITINVPVNNNNLTDILENNFYQSEYVILNFEDQSNNETDISEFVIDNQYIYDIYAYVYKSTQTQYNFMLQFDEQQFIDGAQNIYENHNIDINKKNVVFAIYKQRV